MNKILTFLLAAVFLSLVTAGCISPDPEPPAEIPAQISIPTPAESTPVMIQLSFDGP